VIFVASLLGIGLVYAYFVGAHILWPSKRKQKEMEDQLTEAIKRSNEKK